MPAGRLDGSGEFAGIEVACALEDHVFEKVRDAGSEVLVFVHAASLDPDFGAYDGICRFRLEDEGEPVGQGFNSGGGGWIFHEFPTWILGILGAIHDRCNVGF